MFCNKCGKEIRNDAKFCNHCGIEVRKVEVEKKCQICGAINRNDEKYCKVCGSQIDIIVNPVYGPTHNIITSYNEDIYAPQPDKYGHAAMVISIVSISTTVLCCMFPFGIIGGLVSFVFGILSTRQSFCQKGKAITGIVCGSIAFFLGIIILIAIIYIMNNPQIIEAYLEYLEQAGITFN